MKKTKTFELTVMVEMTVDDGNYDDGSRLITGYDVSVGHPDGELSSSGDQDDLGTAFEKAYLAHLLANEFDDSYDDC